MNPKLILKSLKLLALVLACLALAPVPQARPEDRGNGFLDQLEQVWNRDAGRAVLYARWYSNLLPEELVQQSAMLQAQAQAAQSREEINRLVAPWLGSRGSESGLGTMDPVHAAFITTIGTIRMHRGDPPASPEMAQLAEAVLRGQVDPENIYLAAAPAFNRPQVAMQIQMVQRMDGDMLRLLRFSAIIDAACALPRERIPVLIPDVR
jgi:hypothetical protein